MKVKLRHDDFEKRLEEYELQRHGALDEILDRNEHGFRRLIWDIFCRRAEKNPDGVVSDMLYAGYLMGRTDQLEKIRDLVWDRLWDKAEDVIMNGESEDE